jgi:hypothetical protein
VAKKKADKKPAAAKEKTKETAKAKPKETAGPGGPGGPKKVEFLKVKKGDRLAVFKFEFGYQRIQGPALEVTGDKFDYEQEIAERLGAGKYQVYLCATVTAEENTYQAQKQAMKNVKCCEFELE